MSRDDAIASRRLDGWKAIAAYYNRDRTTVMRWARERKLPVHRLPGGKQGSVFAFESELAVWAGQLGEHEAREATASEADHRPEPSNGTVERRKISLLSGQVIKHTSLFFVISLMLVSVLSQSTAIIRSSGENARGVLLPANSIAARDYVAARDKWARRTPAGLSTAIQLYRGVLRREPKFAPAHVGIADAWLIIREYGNVNEAAAYRDARKHAEEALRLDPSLPGAHRALGFIDYWWDGKTDAALARFKRALSLDPGDGQTHFWYANVLADIGKDSEAQREYDKARLLSPGSRVIDVEQACAHWQAGRDQQALEQLTTLAQDAPDDATIQNCLAWVHISRGDIVNYTRALSRRARLRGEPELLRTSAALNAALKDGPNAAAQVLIAEGRREIANGLRKTRETPAFHASATGNRKALLALLLEANDLGERWPSAPVTSRIAARWRSDAEVQRLLRTLLPGRGAGQGHGVGSD
jgi:tetratricopeptide (TPR) repeat protein